MEGLPGKPQGAIDKLHQSSGTLQIIFIVFVDDKNSGLQTWIICGRFFRLGLARFQINFRRSVMRIGPTDIFSDCLDAALQLWDGVLQAFSHSDA